MAGISHTSVTRYAAAKIIMEASHIAAKNNTLKGTILQSYFELCQDPDIIIKQNALIDISKLLKNINVRSAEADFLPEVFLSFIHSYIFP